MRRGCEAFDGKFARVLSAILACADFFENRIVVRWITDECHTFVVFRRGADEGHATDVDVFDGIRIGNVGFGDGLFERIEVDGDEVNVIPAEIESC